MLDGINAQELVNKYHGTGRLEISDSREWKSIETVIADRIVGVNIDPRTGAETLTTKFKIHYSKTGTHIVPTLKG